MTIKNLLSAGTFATAVLVSGVASASTYGFYDITTDNSTNLSSQLSMTVTQVGDQALFTVNNAASGVSSSIAQVYFDFGTTDFFAPPSTTTTTTYTTTTTTYTWQCTQNCGKKNEKDGWVAGSSTATSSSSGTVGTSGSTSTNGTKIGQTTTVATTTSQSTTTQNNGGIAWSASNSSATGVGYTDGGSPSNLPAGNTVGFTADDMGSATSPNVPKNGVNPGEYVGFLGTFSNGGNFAALLAALNSGNFRIGLHVISEAPTGGSDSYVNTAVPLPAAAWLFGSALFGFMGWSNRRKV